MTSTILFKSKLIFYNRMTNINGTFSLKEGFPPKVLSEKKKTISELKLQGSTLIQSLN
jgi:hypothetical protein